MTILIGLKSKRVRLQKLRMREWSLLSITFSTPHIYFYRKHLIENNGCRMAESTAGEMSASSTSTADEKKVRRRRKILRCCGLYSPLAPRSGEHPRRQANIISQQDSSKAATVREARNAGRAFALYTHVHGMKNIYRAEGQ